MNAGKIVEEFLTAIENNDFTKAESYLAKDFKVTGVAPEPLGSREFLGVHRAFGKAMPDFRFNYRIISERGNQVDLRVKLTGTQINTLPSPVPGIKDIPATNKKVIMPEEPLEITVKENKIAKLHLTHVDGGGLPGVLKQLGVEMPAEVAHH